ncbi:hypothetical protein DFQ28_007152 [Apophysomyces sp. BC1034]|nr:hypothetical protein DFQ30_006960 [Apophysomyces sp. BC1015]KAG0176621.1 hypothetical protein DFQ29_005887 [Apophysomyces sp. BC1021]KAG0186907.1 hypothetical protein DFQ28_007152 [Apophysomyces sp. BC1034]
MKRGTAKLIADLKDDANNALDALHKGRGTWYFGKDLKKAACYDRNGLSSYDASPDDLIGAMAMNDFEECYKCVKIVNNDIPELSVVIKIIDKCAACKIGKAIDLTPAAFQAIAPGGDLNIGVLDISWQKVPCHHSHRYPGGPKTRR